MTCKYIAVDLLTVHLLPLPVVCETLDTTLDVTIDKPLDVVDMITCLTAMFERVADDTQVNVPLAVDLTLNWLLNVYDRSVPDDVTASVRHCCKRRRAR